MNTHLKTIVTILVIAIIIGFIVLGMNYYPNLMNYIGIGLVLLVLLAIFYAFIYSCYTNDNNDDGYDY